MENKKDFSECFWTFVYLVVTDDRYLSKEGCLIKQLVNSRGYCKSISDIARALKIQKPRASKMCKILENMGCITLVKQKNSKIVKFNDEIIISALKIPNKILGDEE